MPEFIVLSLKDGEVEVELSDLDREHLTSGSVMRRLTFRGRTIDEIGSKQIQPANSKFMFRNREAISWNVASVLQCKLGREKLQARSSPSDHDV
jgi:hypothetical protein